jgi:hypothetical protein
MEINGQLHATAALSQKEITPGVLMEARFGFCGKDDLICYFYEFDDFERHKLVYVQKVCEQPSHWKFSWFSSVFMQTLKWFPRSKLLLRGSFAGFLI